MAIENLPKDVMEDTDVKMDALEKSAEQVLSSSSSSSSDGSISSSDEESSHDEDEEKTKIPETEDQTLSPPPIIQPSLEEKRQRTIQIVKSQQIPNPPKFIKSRVKILIKNWESEGRPKATPRLLAPSKKTVVETVDKTKTIWETGLPILEANIREPAEISTCIAEKHMLLEKPESKLYTVTAQQQFLSYPSLQNVIHIKGIDVSARKADKAKKQ